jgi:uncharacterized iron-regulated membrane protein
MPSYLLPCQCGKEHRVETVQAGEKIACACGQSLTVPTLRGMKALAVAPSEAGGSQKAAGKRTHGRGAWSPLHGAAFSIGLLVAMIALVVIAISAIQYMQVAGYTTDYTPQVNEYDAALIDQLSPPDSLDVFHELVKDGLGTPQPPIWVQAQELVQGLKQRMIWSAVALAIGVMMATGAVLFRSRPAAAAA